MPDPLRVNIPLKELHAGTIFPLNRLKKLYSTNLKHRALMLLLSVKSTIFLLERALPSTFTHKITQTVWKKLQNIKRKILTVFVL